MNYFRVSLIIFANDCAYAACIPCVMPAYVQFSRIKVSLLVRLLIVFVIG